MRQLLVVMLSLFVGVSVAQTGPPEPTPENYCEPEVSLFDVGLRSIPGHVKTLVNGGYETQLHIFGQADDACRFDSDEWIWFVIEIRNTMPLERSIFFNTSRQYDLELYSGRTGQLVYRWGDQLAWDDELTAMTFEPGETKRFFAWWNAAAFEPGDYDAVGTIRGMPAPATSSSSRRVELLP